MRTRSWEDGITDELRRVWNCPEKCRWDERLTAVGG
jgi:hypothetical protein